jgi:sigma-B regulation protein RsbU (phosphoserine phosphatase)
LADRQRSSCRNVIRVEAKDALWREAIATLLHTSHLAQPSALASVINEAVRPYGIEITLYLVDREQERLRPLPEPGKATAEPLAVDGTIAGQVFRRVTAVASHRDPRRVWVPVLDGTERLGVLEATLPEHLTGPAGMDGLRTLSVLIGHLIASKLAYGDALRRVRRSQPMSVGGELLWRMLPPLTFATDDLVLSAAIEPCYDFGGDAYDYAVDDDRARITVIDAVGHGLNAALTSTVTLAATRAARAVGDDLPEVALAADAALIGQFGDLRYVTGVLAELDLRTGRLRFVNAGHPPPVVLRHGQSVAVLKGGRRLPLGLDGPIDEPAQYSLEPGDLLMLYTDGITEARDERDEFFGLRRLSEHAERQTNAGHPAAEVARGLARAVRDFQNGRLQDDATLLLAQWGPGVGRRMLP